jgi:hypothetical protein
MHTAKNRETIGGLKNAISLKNFLDIRGRCRELTVINHDKHPFILALFENKSKGTPNSRNLRTFCNSLTASTLHHHAFCDTFSRVTFSCD